MQTNHIIWVTYTAACIMYLTGGNLRGKADHLISKKRRKCSTYFDATLCARGTDCVYALDKQKLHFLHGRAVASNAVEPLDT